MSAIEKLKEIRAVLDEQHVKLIAVSKTRSTTDILEVYNAGHKVFGENRVNELVSKYEELPKDIKWHMIGHLQTNKVKYIAPFVHLIHSVDSLKLLKEINKRAQSQERVIDCLLQVHIAREEAKFGFSYNEIEELLAADELTELDNVRIIGLMGMATFTDNEAQVRDEFRKLTDFFKKIKAGYFIDKDHFKELSIGMSADYSTAVEEGSTMVRIGSLIFGERNY